ncbi:MULTISPECIES: Gfo/Idh/MocA family oxidoreductase [unclassified Crossiella]|uniref:Gfo/Idh/MocA family oxidoreductase n=1 Tax=unclassified Crossiella TaxID=2620835 RepID=UPI001FFED842|nr:MULTISPECIES: Gfo/Idh/MocA family oxidoreductase [unclassified Crossiella]MCK2244658.1 Gfo/Idh/MocA family oxidoreductase [Crossiella sp. S99.2]MCK2258355.1 Gfo/Idh/MocA family oxidoreductase [Crossiella sp. S99.1]
MNEAQPRPVRVVVAGTAFGRIYLDAVRSAPDAFVLAGVLSTGGAYSRDLASRHDVPLYTAVEQVPEVDLACVVVRSGLLGGPGSELAQAFLGRGTHVLQEHPVHAGEIADNLRAARRGGAAYAVNTLYPDLAPVRRFLAAVEVLRRSGPLRFVDAACANQVAYPLVEILARIAGSVRPFSFGAATGPDGQPYRTLHATVGGLPVTLRVQNQLHPADADNHAHFFHRITVGGDAGVLSLADTHGPVLWQPRLHAGRDDTGRLIMAGPGSERLATPSTTVLGPEAGTFHQVFAELWPDAVRTALHRLVQDIHEPARRARTGQWALGVATAWSALTARLGVPQPIHPEEPPVLPVAQLLAAVAAEDARGTR